MTENVTYSVGNLALIEKADGMLDGYLDYILGGIQGRMTDFKALIKALMYNRLGDCLPVNHLTEYPEELFRELGCEEVPCERSFYRALERLGKGFGIVLQRHQECLVKFNLVSDKQFVDFSSTYFEGKAEDAGEYGYSRDNQPNKKQVTFGICTGINGIPLALTVQKGNVQDKAHFRFMLRAVNAVMPEGTLLIFDCGANTKANKSEIREDGHHYLTLKAKKVNSYKSALKHFGECEKIEFEMNGKKYKCLKRNKGDETEYIYFSQDLFVDQIKAKERKYTREKTRNASLLKKTKNGKPIGQYYCDEGVVIAKGILQSTLFESNPYFNGIEGFFILESSVDTTPEHIMSLYKDRDKAEKLIRNIKEGTEIRPVRHWNKSMIMGYILLIFLTNFLVQLTHLRTQSSISTNIKRLKKNITKLTVTVVYPKDRFKFQVLSNETDEIRSFLGDSIERFRDESYNFRW